jgi:hypothetical protein
MASQSWLPIALWVAPYVDPHHDHQRECQDVGCRSQQLGMDLGDSSPPTTAGLMEDLGHVNVPSSHFVCVGRISLLVQYTMAEVIDDIDRCHERIHVEQESQKNDQYNCNVFFLFFDCCLV